MDFASDGFGIAYATKKFVLDELKSKKLYEIKVEPKVNKLIEIMKKDYLK